MTKGLIAAAALVALLPASALAQDAKAVIANASKAMGADGLNSIYFNGSGANFGLGQSNNANGEWPRTNLNDYVRAIDFTNSTSRATAVTWAAPVTGPVAVQGQFQQNIGAAQAGSWAQQLEIWTTPWGFLEGGRGQQRHGAGADDRRPALSGGDLDDDAEVAGRAGVSRRRLHQPAAVSSIAPRPGSRTRSSATCTWRTSSRNTVTPTA